MAIQTTGQTFAGIEKVMKEFYLPAWKNGVNLETTPLMTDAAHNNAAGKSIISAAEFGANGGFGFGTDSGVTPGSGRQMYEQFREEFKDIFCNIEITDKTIAQAKKGANIIDPLESEIKGAFKTAKYHVGRSLYGNGSGILAFFNASTEGYVIKVVSTKYLTIGSTVDIYDGTEDSHSLHTEKARIVGVNRRTNEVSFDKIVGGLSEGFITLQNSYNMELTGLGSIFDPQVKTLYGLEKSENYYLQPIQVDAKQDINDTLIRKTLRDSTNYNNGNVNMLLCGNEAYDAYAEYLRLNGYRIEDHAMNLKGGFKAISFLNGEREVAVVNDKHIPGSEMWGFDKSAIAFYDLRDWDFVEHENGGLFTLVDGTSRFRALLACYTNVMCANPGGCVRIYNVCDGETMNQLFHESIEVTDI